VGKKSEITGLGILFDLYQCEQRAEVFAKGTRRNAVNWDMRSCNRVKTFTRFSEGCFAYSFSTGTRLQRVKYREIAFLLLSFLSRKFLAEKSISKVTC